MAHYSEHHKVPTVSEFREIEKQREQASLGNGSELPSTEAGEAAPPLPVKDESVLRQRKNANTSGTARKSGQAGGDSEGDDEDDDDAPPDDQFAEQSGQAEKERLKQQSAPQGKPTDNFQTKGKRRVEDPTTGGEVIIADSRKNAKTDPKKLEARYFDDKNQGYSTHWPNDRSKMHPRYVSPNPAQPSNVLIHPFPEPLDVDSMTSLTGSFKKLEIGIAVGSAVIWFFTAFGSGYQRFFFRSALISGLSFVAITATHLALRKIEKDLEAVRTHMHTQRGQDYVPPMPESVEWLNAAIAVVWRQIDPATFIPIADQIEDVMQQSLPGFIQAVKISDLSHGSNPFRLVCMRALADVMGEKGYPRADWIHQGKEDEKTKEDEKAEKKAAENDADGDGIADDDEAGDFYNVEVSFSYSAQAGSSAKDRAENMHLLIEFFLGAYDLFQLPLPIWAQIEHISGTIRVRAQFIQSPPYVRNVTFSLMGVPRIEVSVQPMTKALPNVLDLPLISSFVQMAIGAAANMFVAPKSMTLNLEEMLSGAAANDTQAVGVLWIVIGRGEGLSAQDANGKSDPYVNIAFAKFGRPLFSSRIIFEDLNPNWNEGVPILVTRDDVRGNEELSVQLWDSDQRTADDIVGRVRAIPLSELIKRPNQLQERSDKLAGFEDADEMLGTFHWKIGFFEKAQLNKDLQRQAQAKKQQEEKEEKERLGEKYKAPPKPTKEEEEAPADATLCPPDPSWPCAILGVTVNSISALATREIEEGVKGKEREGTYGQDVDATQEGKNLPSAYCEVVVNDDIRYKTRVKPYSNAPVFNAGTEVFVRDWQRGQVSIIVRDARVREHDPILGIVSIPLAEVFRDCCATTRPFAIQDGVGYGRVNLTLNIRPVQLQLPRSELGWDTATVELLSDVEIKGHTPEWDAKLKAKKLRTSTGDDTQRLRPSKGSSSGQTGGAAGGDTSSASAQTASTGADDDDDLEAVARLPVYDRYSSSLTFDFGGGAKIGPIGGKPDAIAVWPLSKLVDDEVMDIEVPILAGENLGTLKRNNIDEHTKRTHKFEEVGVLRVKVRLDSGLDEDHEKLAKARAARHAYDVYNRQVAMPNRAEVNSHANDDGVIDRKEQKSIDRAKTEALHARHRGSHGYAPIRSAVWAKDGIKDRMRKASNTLRGKKDNDSAEKKIQSEA
ncbi:unnamed protein product [Parajaminaea phylloscopi]